jgi:predicted nuclease of predicted toxin-antitoxin system
VARFLADENIAPTSVRRLRWGGHDLAAIREETPGLPDHAVLARAVREQRILLTQDSDYGELIYHRHHPAPVGVVYFRLGDEQRDLVATFVLALIEDRDAPLDGWYTTVDVKRIRRRPLP